MKNTVEQLLDTSSELLASYGYAAFSYGLLANRLSISKGLINYHFPRKSMIFRRLVERYFEQAADFLTDAIPKEGTAFDLLRAYVSGCLRYVQENRVSTLAVLEIISNARNDDGSLIYASDRGLAQPIVSILTYGQETGEFLPFDCPFMAQIIRDLIDSFSYRIAHDPGTDVSDTTTQLTAAIDRMVGGTR